MDIAVRSAAPAWLFGDRVRYQRVLIEPRVAEAPGALSVDAAGSAAAVREFAAGLDEVVEREAAWVRSNGVRAIYADIPFIAGFIGKAAGIPVIAAGNFLWNWILADQPGIGVIAEGYALCDLALRYPLSHDEGWEIFRRSEQVPLVTPRSKRDRDEIRAELGLLGESRPAVLVGGRARLEPEAEARIRETCSDFVFLSAEMLPNYHDLVRASDVVVSKAGYSIVAECIAEGRPLLYPPRTGFREEEMLMRSAERLMRCAPIAESLWRAGEWGGGLRRLLAMPGPPDFIDTHGAEFCAEILIKTAV